jgi:TM2 domain-containing membrane protein YozV
MEDPTPSSGSQDEPLKDWSYNPAYQQSPVDHFSAERLPACSRKRAMLLALFLGMWGIQRFYLRRPTLGWVSLVVCKAGIGLGLIAWFLMGDFVLGLSFTVAGALIAEIIGIADAIALQSGRMSVDGVGKPLAP